MSGTKIDRRSATGHYLESFGGKISLTIKLRSIRCAHTLSAIFDKACGFALAIVTEPTTGPEFRRGRPANY